MESNSGNSDLSTNWNLHHPCGNGSLDGKEQGPGARKFFGNAASLRRIQEEEHFQKDQT